MRAIAPIRAPPGGRLRQVAGSWPGIAGLSGLPAWVPETSGQVNIGLICGGRGIKSEQSRTDGGKLMAKSAPVRKLSQAVGTGVADLPSNAAWLLSKALKSGRGPAEAAAQAASSVAGGVSDKATAAAETAGSATSAARETAGSATSAARETAGSATSAARKNARAAGRAVTQVMPAMGQDSVADLMERADNAADHAGQHEARALELAEEARDRAQEAARVAREADKDRKSVV